MVLVVLDLEEVHTLEVVHLAPGDPHPVRRHLAVLVHNVGHHGRVQEGEGVLEGAGGPRGGRKEAERKDCQNVLHVTILELLGLNKIPKLSHSQIYPCKSVVLLTSECFAFVSGPEGHISECLLSEH